MADKRLVWKYIMAITLQRIVVRFVYENADRIKPFKNGEQLPSETSWLKYIQHIDVIGMKETERQMDGGTECNISSTW